MTGSSSSWVRFGRATRKAGFETIPAIIHEIDSQQDLMELDEVVVTALGISREKKALGYATTQVDGEKLEDKAESDVARALQGQSSGVNITSQNGMSGSGTNIVIRGMSSFSQSNQALFMVDGVPFSNYTNTSNNN